MVKHNQKLKKKMDEERLRLAEEEKGTQKKRAKVSTSVEVDVPVEFQDQGYTRPRVLILCPFRGTAFKLVMALKHFLGKNTTISQVEKFVEEYGSSEEDGGCSEEEGVMNKKPQDWKHIFDQNVDDDFKLGLQVNPGQGKGSGAEKGAYIRLYSDFFLSDIIIASPLGLRLAVENGKSPQSFDFLSSLEIVIIHQTDVIFMQNFEHVQFILSKCNRLPEHDHDTDFSRIRPYFLSEKSSEHRQLVMTTHFNDPKIQSLMREFGKSCTGNVRVKKNWGEGCVSLVTSKVHQVFQVIKSVSFETDLDERFTFFKDKILSQILRLDQKHTLIVAPSYLDYIRIRNELLRQEASVAFVCEYSRDSEVSRGRSRFFHGQKSILLYSGRSHFFRRFLIRGALHVIFYSLPAYPHFYNEIVNILGSGLSESTKDAGMSCTVLTSKYEQMALERIVGQTRVEYMMNSKKSVFMFC